MLVKALLKDCIPLELDLLLLLNLLLELELLFLLDLEESSEFFLDPLFLELLPPP